MNEFHQRCKKIARRFLQTVVIVDDEAYIAPAQSPGILEKPTRRTLRSGSSAIAAKSTTSVSGEGEDDAEEVGFGDRDHRLDARTLVESFSKQGLVCAVVVPRSDTDSSDIVDPSVKRTDIVILDWQLNGDNGKKTLSILKSILKEDAGERLRLIAIYTGEQRISEIGRTIVEEWNESKRKFEGNKHNVVLSHRHCRIVIYSKSNLPAESGLSGRSLSESELPDALIGDFSVMAEGLLPNIALMSLAAIRENVHKVLDRFDAKLDPALLTHRACLPVPDDSQQHMVDQLASELHAIMDDAVATGEPAGMAAIKEWLDAFLGENMGVTFGKGKKASRDETVALLENGLAEWEPSILSKSKGFRDLTGGLSYNEDLDHKLDHRLAWMFNFRTICNAPPPVLQLGTVLWKSNSENALYFLCMRPKCDSVRLQEKTAFLLLPLVEPQPNSIQLVLHVGEDTYRRVSVCMEAGRWSLVNFVPDENKGSVVAGGDYPCFYFTDENNVRFHWLGELKAEFAQRIVQHLATGLSRIPINNTEWLRREEEASRGKKLATVKGSSATR